MPEQATDASAIALAMKRELTQGISLVLIRYQQQHGLSPSQIHVDMMEVTTLGDQKKNFVLGDIRVDFTF